MVTQRHARRTGSAIGREHLKRQRRPSVCGLCSLYVTLHAVLPKSEGRLPLARQLPRFSLGWENRQYANTQTAQIRRNTQEYSAHPARSAAKIFGQYCELVSKYTDIYAHTEYANTQAIQIRSNIQQYHTPPTWEGFSTA